MTAPSVNVRAVGSGAIGAVTISSGREGRSARLAMLEPRADVERCTSDFDGLIAAVRARADALPVVGEELAADTAPLFTHRLEGSAIAAALEGASAERGDGITDGRG